MINSPIINQVKGPRLYFGNAPPGPGSGFLGEGGVGFFDIYFIIPVNNNLKGLDYLEELWRAAGVQRIDKHYYKDGRHEMLNEINRDEVTDKIINWIKDVYKF